VSGGERLRVLHLEDDDDDAALVARELRRAGFDAIVARAEDGPSFERALRAATEHGLTGAGCLALDLVLADYALPTYDGLSALRALRALDPEVPFIFVSGVLGEERALEAMRAGARDFVLKHRLSLLGPAVARELADRRERRARLRAERALLQEAARKRALFESAPIVLMEVDAGDLLAELRRRFAGAASSLRGDDARARLEADPTLLEALASKVRIVDLNDEAVRVLELPGRGVLLGDIASIARSHGGPSATVASVLAIILGGGGRFVAEVDYRTYRGRVGRGLVGVELPGPDAQDGRFVASMLDLTPLRRLEQQVHSARRVESVGALAAGVAHDFNNLLSIITGHLEFVREALDGDAQSSGDLGVALEAAQRAAALTRQLLGFARAGQQRPQVLEPCGVIERTRQLLARTLGEHVELVVRHGEGVGGIYIDPTQLEQILVNLAVNARDAMPRGGTITVSTERVDLGPDDPRVRSGALVAGPYVDLAVEDTGHGMDAVTLERAFEPLFTTKAPGRGTGLGLATVHAIVTAAGGWIGARSELGSGTRFDVLLPRAGTPPVVEPVVAPTSAAPQTGRVLLVEDDALVRATARRILERAGHHVTECASAAEAIATSAREPTPFDLLLSDVVMPGMHGADLARRLLADGRVLRVLLMSGYTPDDLGELPGPIVAKPFTDRTLRAHVETVLRGSEARLPDAGAVRGEPSTTA
jgi:signal transduction histidine kinase/CheY-like chemotaxis protein